MERTKVQYYLAQACVLLRQTIYLGSYSLLTDKSLPVALHNQQRAGGKVILAALVVAEATPGAEICGIDQSYWLIVIGEIAKQEQLALDFSDDALYGANNLLDITEIIMSKLLFAGAALVSIVGLRASSLAVAAEGGIFFACALAKCLASTKAQRTLVTRRPAFPCLCE